MWLIFLSNYFWQEADGDLIPPTIALSSENISDDGIYLLENGDDCLIYVGSSVGQDIIRQLFGVSSIEEVPTLVLSSLSHFNIF